MTHIVDSLGIVCPKGHTELTPASLGKPITEARWMIRPFKVSDECGSWSECMVCAGVLTATGEPTGQPNNKRGWYCS